MLILHGRILLPVGSSAIVDGAVAVDGAVIVAFGKYQQINERFPDGRKLDLTDCAILPGLVNAHTHLELSGLKGQIKYNGNFIDWVGQVRRLRQKLGGCGEELISQACRESLQSGTTTIGDICYEHRAWRVLADQRIRKRCFAETYGMLAELDDTRRYLTECIEQTQCDELLRLGISPHGPYSAGPAVYKMSAELARQEKLALTTHLAETTQEREFLLNGGGPWLDFLRKIDRWDGSFQCPHLSPVKYFLQLELAGQAFLLAHVNYISDDELELLAQTNHSVAYCPRSHHYFGHRAHRFEQMLSKGINVCLGTDSLASNSTLSILDEMRFIHKQHPGFNNETLLKMATVNGAMALGWQDKVGTIAADKEADLIAIPLTKPNTEPLSDILESSVGPKLTMVRGEIV